MFSVELVKKLEQLGMRLLDARLLKNESQKRFASRLGISVPTLRKMEKGEPASSIGVWAEALYILDRLDDLDAVLATKQSLFDKRDEQVRPKRKRASGNKPAGES